MGRLERKAQIDKVIYLSLEQGEDVLEAIWSAAKEHDIKAGVILQGNATLQRAVIQGYPHNPLTCSLPIDVFEINGPLLADISGVIGITAKGEIEMDQYDELSYVEGVIETEDDKWHMLGSQGGVGTPYVHSNFTSVNKDVSQLGRLMPGTTAEYATLVIAKMKNIEFQMKLGLHGAYNDILQAR